MFAVRDPRTARGFEPRARMRRSAEAGLAILVAGVLWGSGAFAQQAGPPPGDPPGDSAGQWGDDPAGERDGHHHPRELLGAVFFWKMVDVLGLTEDQIPPAMAKMKTIERAERDHRTQREASLDRLRLLLKQEKPDEGAIRDEIKKMRTSEDSFRDEREHMKDEFLKTLSVQQQAKLVLYEEEFPRHLQEMRERVRDRFGRGGDGADRRDLPH